MHVCSLTNFDAKILQSSKAYTFWTETKCIEECWSLLRPGPSISVGKASPSLQPKAWDAH
jgi:hypothetical protein